MATSLPPARRPARKALSPIKWFLGVLTLLAVIISCGGLGIFLSGGHERAVIAPNPTIAAVKLVIGVVLASVGGIIYAAGIATRGFNADFSRPITQRFARKIWLLNLIVSLFLQGGIAFMVSPLFTALIWRVLPGQIADIGGFFLPLIAAQFLFIWLLIWQPLGRIIIHRRLEARGIEAAYLVNGILLGLSDPSKNSFKKMTIVEEDLGMLWISPTSLSYRGDQIDFDITGDQVRSIEQRADAGATSSYFGASQIILRYVEPAGAERVVRLHTESEWTATAKAHAADELAERLRSWKLNHDIAHAGSSVSSADR